MKHATFRTFTATLEDVARDIVRASRRVVREIAVMPWPAMLVCCIGLALLISILPLALFLFVAFLGVKLVVGAFVLDANRNRRERTAHHEG
jgi:hypothetical protein